MSLVLPAYNEQEVIEQAVREADEALSELTDEYEILVVDDGSRDDTAAIVRRLAQTIPSVRLLQQPRNRGYGAALRRGFDEARQPLVAFTDADCQFDLRELDRLLLLAEKHDIACGYRIDRQDPWYRKLYSKGYNVLVRTLLGTGVRDCDCALKVFRREVIQSIPIETSGFFVNAEMLTKARQQGRSIVDVGVTHRPRPRGQSTVSLRHAVPVAFTLLRFWWNTVQFPARQDAEAAEPAVSRLQQGGALLLLVLIAALLLLPNLSYPLLEPDETRYAQISLEMAQSGDWVTPTLDGEPYLDKPPLLYWMTAASLLLFGENEFAARFPCALASLLTVLAIYVVGKRLVGTRAAWCGAVALLLCGGYVLAGRFLLMDGPLALFTTVALLTGYLACGESRFRLTWWLAASAACGLGVLTKGPVAVVLVVPPLLATRWLTPDSARLKLWHYAAFGGVIAAMTLPWFVAISAAHDDFSGYFFWRHHVVRFLNTFTHQEPWWFYLPVLLVGTFPLSLLLGPLVWFLLGRSVELQRRRSRELGFLAITAIWTVFFFSLSSCKLPTYVVPAVPMAALLVGAMLDRVALTPGLRSSLVGFMRWWPRHAANGVLITAILISIVGLLVVKMTPTGRMLDIVVAIAAAVAIPALWRLWPKLTRGAWAGFAAISLALIAFTFVDFLPAISRYRSIHREAASLRVLNDSAPVVYFGCNAYAAGFHLKPGEFVQFRNDQRQELEAFVRDRTQTVVVSNRDSAPAVRRSLESAFRVTPSRIDSVFLLAPRDPAADRLSSRPAATNR